MVKMATPRRCHFDHYRGFLFSDLALRMLSSEGIGAVPKRRIGFGGDKKKGPTSHSTALF